jgi:hypothetical protein
MKTLIAVTTCARYSDRRAAIRETWMTKAAVDVRFITGVPIPDAVCLNVPDTYAELPQKTFATVRYALDRGYDVLIKVDDDTFFMPLPHYVAEFAKHDCLCHVRANSGNPYPQGGCYSLNRRAMSAVLAHPELFTTGLEDAAVGKALAAEGIALTHTERIKTTVVFGHPATWNNIIAAHCCPPRDMRNIFNRFNGIGRAGQMSGTDHSKSAAIQFGTHTNIYPN